MDGGIRRHHLTLVVPGLLQHRPGDRGATEGPLRVDSGGLISVLRMAGIGATSPSGRALAKRRSPPVTAIAPSPARGPRAPAPLRDRVHVDRHHRRRWQPTLLSLREVGSPLALDIAYPVSLKIASMRREPI